MGHVGWGYIGIYSLKNVFIIIYFSNTIRPEKLKLVREHPGVV